jgi:hypothetical protein
MRQVFSSQRLENVERVAELLREAGIEVRITDGRSYKGAMRSRSSYADQSQPKPAVWVVQSNDQIRARELLREHGLLESTRPTEGFVPLSFRDDAGAGARVASTSQKRTFRFKVGLLLIMAVIIVMAMLRGCYTRPEAPTATAPAGQSTAIAVGGTPEAVAQAAFARELTQKGMVLCLSVDGADASPAVLASVAGRGVPVVPGSACVRDFDTARGSFEKATGKPALLGAVHTFQANGPDAGTVQFEAFHHGEFAHYKTLEVRRVGGQWQVTRVLRHVASYALPE